MDGFGDSFVPVAAEDAAPPVDGAAPPPAAEVDPAAEFLAREQDQLAGLEDDLAAVTVSAAAPDSTGLGGGDSGDLFGSSPAPADAPVIVNGTADLESFEMLGGDEVAPELSGAPAAASELLAEGEGFGGADFGFSEVTVAEASAAAPMAADEGAGVDYSALSMMGASEAAQEPVVAEAIEQQQQPAVPESTTPARSVTPVAREEPEKIRLWREEQVKRMEEKDKLEEQAKEELREKAKGELEEWYKQHEEQVAKTRQANRDASKSAEKELVAETSAIEPGTEWERISKLCDFNPKTAKSTRDISRMRSIILQVKQNPPVKA